MKNNMFDNLETSIRAKYFIYCFIYKERVYPYSEEWCKLVLQSKLESKILVDQLYCALHATPVC